MSRLPFIIFFLSGAAALVYENLWFRLAGLNVGNSVWGAAVVLAAFMGGLGLGNWIVCRFGVRIKQQLQAYIILEVLIGVTGIALILIFPFLPDLLSPLFRPLLETGWLLNLCRISLIFLLLLLPTVAMGATLPLMVRAVCKIDHNFGAVLGQLYGWNTIGALTGVILCEFIFLDWFGIRNTGFIALSLNLLAIILAMRLRNTFQQIDYEPRPESDYAAAVEKPGASAIRLLAAVFTCGFILLALEVVWFRFLLLTISGTGLVFAIMLAIVLAGIGMGGLLVSTLQRKEIDIGQYCIELSLCAGIATVFTYIFFQQVYFQYAGNSSPSLGVFLLYATFLMLPTSILSGMLFTSLGIELRKLIKQETRVVGMLTLANTFGAMMGALAAGLLMLVLLGMELSLWILAICYGLVALLIPGRKRVNRFALTRIVPASLFAILILFFPFGLMKDTYFQNVFSKWGAAKIAAISEGLVATNFYYVYEQFDRPKYYRLMTNGYSMSGTAWPSQRYMKLYAYLPAAIHPNMKNALLISYGVGSTAKAITNLGALDTIDIVDISRDALELSDIIYQSREAHPLADKRVNVHIEDGRFFLQTTDKTFDLITGEPPPPKINHVVNLYTQEYFKLIYERLNEGGLTTYWLPVYQLSAQESKSIIKAFCNVFQNCTLWSGAGLEWMLVGMRGEPHKTDRDQFTFPWKDSVIANDLKNTGIELPEQLGSLFLAGNKALGEITLNSLPLQDNFPHRLSGKTYSLQENQVFFNEVMASTETRKRFKNSAFIRQVWPDSLRQDTLAYFDYQRVLSDVFFGAGKDSGYFFADFHKVLTDTRLETLPLLMLKSDFQEQLIARQLASEGDTRNEISLILAKSAISKRQYAGAIALLESYMDRSPDSEQQYIYPFYLYLLCIEKRYDEAEQLGKKIVEQGTGDESSRTYFTWLEETFPVRILPVQGSLSWKMH